MRSAMILVPAISALPVVMMYVYWSTRNRVAPKRRYIGPMIAAVFLSVILSLVTGMAMRGVTSIIPPGIPLLLVLYVVLAAIPEEAVIFTTLCALFREKHWTANAADSMAAGLSLSLGLALFESISFAAMAGDPLGAGLVRGLISVPAHGCWGLIMAACLRYSLWQNAQKPRYWRWAALVLPVLLHSVFDVAVLSPRAWYIPMIVFAMAALMLTGAIAIASQDYLQAHIPWRHGEFRATSRTWCYRLGCLVIGAAFIATGLAGLTGHLGLGQEWTPYQPLMPILPVILGADLVCVGLFGRSIGSFLWTGRA